MTDLDLRRAMDTIAENAPAPPADLLDRVMAGHRRQRRNRARTAAFAAAAVVLAAGTWAALRPPGDRGEPAGGFRLPSSVADAPPLTEVWKAATIVGDLPDTPDGATPYLIGRLDTDHLLIAGVTTLYSYAVGEQTYRPVLDGGNLALGADRAGWAISPRWIVRILRTGTGVEVRRSPAAGGSIEVVAEAAQSPPIRGAWATDDHVYWSVEGTGGVTRASLTDGTVAALPGFENLTADGTPWAKNADATVFRNLLTGEERRVRRPAGADSLRCVPAFCLGHDRDGWYLSAVDGSHRTDLPYPGTPALVGALHAAIHHPLQPVDSGMLLLAGGVLLDPVTGFSGAVTRAEQCDVSYGPVKDEVFYRWSTTVGGACTGPRQTAYVSGGD